MTQRMGVYKLRCKLNDRYYIGQSVDVAKRIAYHFCLLRNGKHPIAALQHDYDMYGDDAFESNLLMAVLSKRDLHSAERLAMHNHGSKDKLYNRLVHEQPTRGVAFGLHVWPESMRNIRNHAKASGKSISQVMNELLYAGLHPNRTEPPRRRPWGRKPKQPKQEE